MGKYSVADAKNSLSKLIDRAVRGDQVVITRHGQPMVELRPVGGRGRPLTGADVDWLKAHRVGHKKPKLNAADLVSQIRDEEWR